MARPKAKVDLPTRALEDLGLTENEAVLYGLMLSRPASTVRELGPRAPFPRTLLYHVLGQLQTRGLVTTHKDAWRTVYVAQDPELLYELLAKKEREEDERTKAIKELIPRLKQTYHLAGKRPTVRVFEGVAEYEKALEDSLVSGASEIYSFEHMIPGKAGLESRRTHDAHRALRKIKMQVLFFENDEALALLTERPYNDVTEYRSVSRDSVLPFETDVSLYAGKVLYTSYYGTHEPIAILIEDAALYTMQKNLFLSLWKGGKDRTLYYTERK